MAKSLVEDAVIIVIDMIKDFLEPGEEFVIDEGRSMYPKMIELLTFAREQKIPIVYAASQGMYNSHLDRYYWQIRDRVSLIPGTDGVTVVDVLRPQAFSDYEVYLPKWKYSAFYGTKLEVILHNPPFSGRNSFIVTGMATNFCCLCTTIDAFNRDYDVIFVEDLNCTYPGVDGTSATTMHKYTVETIKTGYAEVLRFNQLMARLTGRAAVQSAA